MWESLSLIHIYAVRWDLYKEIGSPEIKNDDDYVEALKKMKEIYPETEDGLPVYALSAYNDSLSLIHISTTMYRA